MSKIKDSENLILVYILFLVGFTIYNIFLSCDFIDIIYLFIVVYIFIKCLSIRLRG